MWQQSISEQGKVSPAGQDLNPRTVRRMASQVGQLKGSRSLNPTKRAERGTDAACRGEEDLDEW